MQEGGQQMRQFPALSATPGDEVSSTDEDEPAPKCRRRNFKSGMDKTGTTTVLKKITWPHEVVHISWQTRLLSGYDNAAVCLWISTGHG